MSTTEGPYYTVEGPHWGRHVRKRTANGYECLAWCGTEDGVNTAKWIAEQLNRAHALESETEK